ncbi:MAG: hypothetical protein V1740_04615 [Candidatus Woesearchaeota archaeon]
MLKPNEIVSHDISQGNGLAHLIPEPLIEKGYKIKPRHLGELMKYGKGPYIMIVKKNCGFENLPLTDVYEGAEHSPEDLSKKLPNLTLLNNLSDGNSFFVYGCTMGHTHPDNGLSAQEVYEFFGYGAMLLASRDDAEHKYVQLHVARPGSKVIVPGNCIMTLYNLNMGDGKPMPLLTADMAHPWNNMSDKEVIEEKGGHDGYVCFNWVIRTAYCS